MSNSRPSETDLDFFKEKLQELIANEDPDIQFRMQSICIDLIAGERWRQGYILRHNKYVRHFERSGIEGSEKM